MVNIFSVNKLLLRRVYLAINDLRSIVVWRVVYGEKNNYINFVRYGIIIVQL